MSNLKKKKYRVVVDLTSELKQQFEYVNSLLISFRERGLGMKLQMIIIGLLLLVHCKVFGLNDDNSTVIGTIQGK